VNTTIAKGAYAMKKVVPIFLAVLLTGCQGNSIDSDAAAVNLRTEYLAAAAITATATVTADYGQRAYDFTLAYAWSPGEATVTVLEPEIVAGVKAAIKDGETALVFDGVSLDTGELDGEGLSPVSALPALLEALRSAYIAETAYEEEGALLRITFRDPENGPNVGREVILWMDAAAGVPTHGEILVDGYRVIDCVFTAFEKL